MIEASLEGQPSFPKPCQSQLCLVIWGALEGVWVSVISNTSRGAAPLWVCGFSSPAASCLWKHLSPEPRRRAGHCPELWWWSALQQNLPVIVMFPSLYHPCITLTGKSSSDSLHLPPLWVLGLPPFKNANVATEPYVPWTSGGKNNSFFFSFRIVMSLFKLKWWHMLGNKISNALKLLFFVIGIEVCWRWFGK